MIIKHLLHHKTFVTYLLSYLLTKYGIDIDVAMSISYNSRNHLHFADIQCICVQTPYMYTGWASVNMDIDMDE